MYLKHVKGKLVSPVASSLNYLLVSVTALVSDSRSSPDTWTLLLQVALGTEEACHQALHKQVSVCSRDPLLSEHLVRSLDSA